MRYFELFAVPVDYNVDLATVSKHYLELQRTVHPDRHANASSRDKLMAVQSTAEINDALQTLKHPVKRAEYMLSELGVDIRAEQQTLQDPMFLMQQMELREELEELTSASDPDTAIANFEKQIKQLNAQYSAQLAEQLASNDEQQYQLAADNIRKLKFVYKLREELERIEDSLFDD
ncbi:co-chaperone HscB [Pseudoalteromonas sp. SG43-4]|uniref:co-chaperone HscB n=1 Tax=Pseudoalteromonas sp. SG43-4 TaxID=2760969 RepID=UPI001601C60F|nr:co-chaperone HscB [Pseudoalteromonas sp. SG43-4]MBB1429325.1 co-chaperone HscB [Pseudoalteromonas sp. SG43-4]